MKKVNVKGRSGRIKKTADAQRTLTFQRNHTKHADFKLIHPCSHRKQINISDDPLGARNESILLAIQNCR